MARFGKSLAALAIATIGLGGAATSVANQAAVTKIQNSGLYGKHANTNRTGVLRKSKAERARRQYGYHRETFLMPVNKESFKQARRKQLKKRAVRKAKRNGQA